MRRVRGGYEYEDGPRHVEPIVGRLCSANDEAVSTPDADFDTKADIEGADEELLGDEMRQYRGIAVRCNYASLDRPDAQFSIKECCRDLSTPTQSSWKTLNRIRQHFQGRPRLVWKF